MFAQQPKHWRAAGLGSRPVASTQASPFTHFSAGNSFSPASVDLCGLATSALQPLVFEETPAAEWAGSCMELDVVAALSSLPSKPTQRAQISQRLWTCLSKWKTYPVKGLFLSLFFSTERSGGTGNRKRSFRTSFSLLPFTYLVFFRALSHLLEEKANFLRKFLEFFFLFFFCSLLINLAPSCPKKQRAKRRRREKGRFGGWERGEREEKKWNGQT